jgi:hypothetical protein
MESRCCYRNNGSMGTFSSSPKGDILKESGHVAQNMLAYPPFSARFNSLWAESPGDNGLKSPSCEGGGHNNIKYNPVFRGMVFASGADF